MLWTSLVLSLTLGFLGFLHELGTFLAAKATGVGVLHFRIGTGPPTGLRFQIAETIYSLSWIPFGAKVVMVGRDDPKSLAALASGKLDSKSHLDKQLENQPVLTRLFVASGGPIICMVFCVMVYTGLAFFYPRVVDPTTTLSRVKVEGLPVASRVLSELPSGTRIVAVNGKNVASWDEIVEAVVDSSSPRLRFDLVANAEPLVVEVPGTDVSTRVAIISAMIPLWEPRVGSVLHDSPADLAALQPGDLIVAVDGRAITAWDELVAEVEPKAGKTIVLTVETDDTTLEIPLVPRMHYDLDPATGETREVGRIGIGPLLEENRIQVSPLRAAMEGAGRAWYSAAVVVGELRGIWTWEISPRELGGPILIRNTAPRGFASVLFTYVAFLSVNLAVLSLFPFGVYAAFLLLEGVRGRPLAWKTRQRLVQVGLLLVLGIMLFTLGLDLTRVLGW